MNWSLERAALLIVDMQHAFCSPGGTVSKMGRDVAANGRAADIAAELLKAWRNADKPVVHVRHAHRPGYADGGLLVDEITPGIREMQGLIDGTWDAEIVPGLSPLPGEQVVTKRRYSGFFQTDLEMLLRQQQVDTVAIAGVSTNVCVESTARDAVFRDFRLIVVSDATAATDPELHEGALRAIRYAFGSTPTSAELIARLRL